MMGADGSAFLNAFNQAGPALGRRGGDGRI